MKTPGQRQQPAPVRPSRVARGRAAGRIAAFAIAMAVTIVIVAQYRGIVARNLALAGELARTRADVDALRARQRRETRELARLQSPDGAIPLIHDKLRMVGPHEEMILLKGDVPPTAEPELPSSDSGSEVP